MSTWRPSTEPSRVSIRGKPILNENTRRVSMPVTVGGKDFVWEMSVAVFKEIQRANERYALESHRYDLEVSYEDTQRRRFRVVVCPRYIVTWTDPEGATGESYESYPTRAEATEAMGKVWRVGDDSGVTYKVRQAS